MTSLCCGLATSLTQLIIFRVLQGLTGGGLQPLAQAILLETFPKERHGHAMAAFGIGILLAPILGPTLGGWITDNYSWRWIFYLNLPVGGLSLFLMNKFVFDPHYVKRGKGKGRSLGDRISGAGYWVAADGARYGPAKGLVLVGIHSSLPGLCMFGLIALIIRELMTDHPVVDLRVLKNRSFSAGVFLISMLGFVLYASLVLLPLYLQTLMGYPAYNSGLALSPRGLGALLFTPLAGHLTTKTDPRRLLAVGIVLGSITMFQLSGLNLNAGFWDIFWAQVLQGVALAFLFIPLMALAMSHIRRRRWERDQHLQPDAQYRWQHRHRIDDDIPGAPLASASESSCGKCDSRAAADFTIASRHARKLHRARNDAVYCIAQGSWRRLWHGATHAAMLAFVEAFWLMGVVFLLMLPFLPLLQYSKAVQVPKAVPEPKKVVGNADLRTCERRADDARETGARGRARSGSPLIRIQRRIPALIFAYHTPRSRRPCL